MFVNSSLFSYSALYPLRQLVHSIKGVAVKHFLAISLQLPQFSPCTPQLLSSLVPGERRALYYQQSLAIACAAHRQTPLYLFQNMVHLQQRGAWATPHCQNLSCTNIQCNPQEIGFHVHHPANTECTDKSSPWDNMARQEHRRWGCRSQRVAVWRRGEPNVSDHHSTQPVPLNLHLSAIQWDTGSCWDTGLSQDSCRVMSSSSSQSADLHRCGGRG